MAAGWRRAGVPGADPAGTEKPERAAAADGGKPGGGHGVDPVRKSLHGRAGVRNKKADPAAGGSTGKLPAGERGRARVPGVGHGAAAEMRGGRTERGRCRAEVTVDEAIAQEAVKPIKKMLEISEKLGL